MSAEDPKLPLHAEKILAHTIRPHLLAYCSRTDLFAVVNDEEIIDVYRLGGQKAFNVKRKSPSTTVVGLQWIRNGKCLAIALSNGNVDIVSGETGKIVRHGGDDPFSTDASGSRPSPGAITCLGWGTTLTGNVKALTAGVEGDPLEGLIGDLSTEGWYDRLHNGTTGDSYGNENADQAAQARNAMLNDLPHQLAFIDVESVLPRLSPISPRAGTGARYEMFATQIALDDYFNSMQRKDRLAAEVMLIGHAEGMVRLVIDDILEVGLSQKDNSGTSKEHLLYSSNSQSTHHAILRGAPNPGDGSKNQIGYSSLSLSLFDIPLLSSGGSHLHLIVSRTAQVRDLCSYITYSILCAKADWSTHTNLPSRFMENVNETLDEKSEGNLEQNLFHLAMTGNFSPTILEWLKDELAERGHKRWDHAITTLHADLSKLLQTNLLPSLERAILVTTNLRGLALYYEGSHHFDVSPEYFTSIISALCMLQLLVHEAILILGEEQRQFRAFSKWLRHVIDLAAADPESISARDMAEREAGVLDYPRVLAYLSGGLVDSKLKPIIFAISENVSEVGEIGQKELVEAIYQARDGDAKRVELLSLHTLSYHLNAVCREAHSQILRWQNSASPSVEEVELQGGAVSETYEMRMIRVQQEPATFKVLVVSIPQEEPSKISIQLLPTPLTSTHSTLSTTKSKAKPKKSRHAPEVETHSIPLPPTAQILALNLLTETSLLVLISLSHDNTSGKYHILYIPLTISSISSSFPDLETEEEMRRHIIHTFDQKEGFTPTAMVVGDKKGKEVVVVVGEGWRHWKSFDLAGGYAVSAAAAAAAAKGKGNNEGRGDREGSGIGKSARSGIGRGEMREFIDSSSDDDEEEDEEEDGMAF